MNLREHFWLYFLSRVCGPVWLFSDFRVFLRTDGLIPHWGEVVPLLPSIPSTVADIMCQYNKRMAILLCVFFNISSFVER